MPVSTMVSVAAAGLALLAQISQATIVPTGPNVSWPYQKFVSAPFKPPYLTTKPVAGLAPGYYFLAPDGPAAVQAAPVIMDINGELVWNGPLGHAFSFGVQKYRGEDVLVSWNGTLYPDPLGGGFGTISLRNKHYDIIANVSLPGNFLSNSPGLTYPSNIDLHENYITTKNTIVVTAHNVTRADLSSVGGPKHGWVQEEQVYEIDIASGKVLFSWRSLDHLDKLPFNASTNPLGTDGFDGTSQAKAWGYAKINSVCPYNDEYVISIRYFCAVVAINRKGNVLWRLQGIDGGDFKLGKGADFCYQHEVRVAPPAVPSYGSGLTVYMHDNHNCPFNNGTVPSTGKIIDLDFSTKRATLRTRYINATDPMFSTMTGGLQMLPNGNVLMDHGAVPIFEEFTSSGKILSTIQFGVAQKFKGGFITAQPDTLSYRGTKQPWLGCPTTNPSLVIRDPSHNLSDVTLYMSWNGATQVAAWKIYSGIESPSYTETVNATGFETVVKLPFIEFAQIYPVLKSGTPPHCGQNATSGLVFVPGVIDGNRSSIEERIERLEGAR